MTTIEEIRTFLGLVTPTLGTITMGFMPGDPDAICTLYEFQGEPPEKQFGESGIYYEYAGIQVIFRGAPFDYLIVRAKAERALQALAAITPGPLTGSISTEYLSAIPEQSVFAIKPIDANNRHYLGFNIYFHKVPSV